MKHKVSAQFLIGFASLFAFMLGGFICLLAISRYQLMFPFAFFIGAPAPFGLGFGFAASALYDAVKKKKKLHGLGVLVPTISAAFIVATYLLFLNWMAYNGILRTI